jgi:hypothetical protein
MKAATHRMEAAAMAAAAMAAAEMAALASPLPPPLEL